MRAEGKRASWSGQLAFVMAAAASAIGLGNLWRFPYLAAQYGGGAFIVTYLALVLLLGCPLMLTEIALGRKTRQSQATAFSRLKRGWGFVGILATIVPLLILPHYCVIGGWVLKPSAIADEVQAEGNSFFGRGVYSMIVRYLAPLFVSLILVSEVCRALNIGNWRI